MKVLDVIHDANANLWRSKLRSTLTILAIFVGSFTIILNSAINAGVNKFIDQQIENMGGEGYLEMMPTEIQDQMASMMSGEVQEYTENKDTSASTMAYIKQSQIDEAKKIDGVKSFNGIYRASVDYATGDKTDKRYVLNLNVIVAGFDVDMSNGRMPNVDENAPYEIGITEEFAKALGYENISDAVNQKIQIAVPNEFKCNFAAKRSDCQTMVEATIVGTQAPGILSMGGSRANLSLWNRINQINFEGAEAANLTYQAVADVDPDKIDEIKDKLKEIGLTALSVSDEVGAIRSFFDAILVVFNIFGSIALIAASIGIINTLFMAVQERTREIGLDKALGMSNSKVFLSFSAEAIMLGFWGSVIGIVLSMIVGTAANKLAVETFLKDFPTFQLTIFEPWTMVSIALTIMFIAFLAGTLPARRASKKNPIDALRYE